MKAPVISQERACRCAASSSPHQYHSKHEISRVFWSHSCVFNSSS